MTAPSPHVPDRFIPDEPVTLGEPDVAEVGPDFDPAEVDLTPPPPDCPACETGMIELDGGELYCPRCREREAFIDGSPREWPPGGGSNV